MAEAEAGPGKEAKGTSRKTLKVVSNCTDMERFVGVFGRFYDGDSMFLLTRGTKPAGTDVLVLMCLAGGKPIFKFEGTVEGCYDEEESPFSRPGMKIRVSKVDPKCAGVADELEAEAKKRGLITESHKRDDDSSAEEDEEFFEKATVVSTPAKMWEANQELPWIGGRPPPSARPKPPEPPDDEHEVPTQIAEKAQRSSKLPAPPARTPLGSPDPPDPPDSPDSDDSQTAITEADETKAPIPPVAAAEIEDPARAETMLAPRIVPPDDVKTNPAGATLSQARAATKAAAEASAPAAPQPKANAPAPKPDAPAPAEANKAANAPAPSSPAPPPPAPSSPAPPPPPFTPWEQAHPAGAWGHGQASPSAHAPAATPTAAPVPPMPQVPPTMNGPAMSMPADFSLRSAGPGWGLTIAIAVVASLVGFAAGLWFAAL